MSAHGSRDDINRIIIGLGGQGSRVVNEVRKAVSKEGPIPEGLEFIVVDSDRIALAELDSVPEEQRVHLAAPEDSITETIVPWLPHEFRPKAGGGCGMQRLTGKAMYLVHRHRILETVRAVARKMRERTQASDFMVVLVNAFGGGTGSGMAIDFSLDVRAELKELTGQEAVTFGIGMLPSRAETIQRANGVAMLKELHFLLGHKEPVVVGGRDYSSPFELYFLVGRETMGIERDDELLDSIVRFTLDLGLIPSSNRDQATTGKGAGWVDLQDIRTLVKGAGHMFSTFGHYRAVFPEKDLLAWFEALDRIAEIRKDIPVVVTDFETRKKRLEDAKIALASDEEELARARARAAKLREKGIMGANRPELARVLAGVARDEEDARKRRREIAREEAELSSQSNGREEREATLRDWEARAAEIKARLLAPAQTRTTFTIPLAEPELEHLASHRELVVGGHFAGAMRGLDRLPDYHERTMEVIGKNKILYLPLLNYRLAFHTAAAFPPAVLSHLRRHGFVRYDAAGNPIVNDEHLWMVMAMLSSNARNIDASKVAARAFKEIVEGHVARRAEAKIVPSRSKEFEVVIHAWMVGLQVAPIAPGYPPRLRELEWLLPEYEQVAREERLAQHHAFLYGDPLAFADLTGVAVDRASVEQTNDAVTEFWSSYSPVDAPARWLQLPPLVAEAAAAAEALASSSTSLADAVGELRAAEASAASVERLALSLAQATETVESFSRTYAEAEEPLRDRLSKLVAQLERTSHTPKDVPKLIASEEIAADAAGAVASASTAIGRLRVELPEAVRAAIAGAGDGTDAKRARSSSAVRWAHLVAQAEAGAVRMHSASADALRHLDDLERTLERAQSLLRARALAPLAGPSLAGIAEASRRERPAVEPPAAPATPPTLRATTVPHGPSNNGKEEIA